ncbi:MAG: hypothetical protein OQL16_14350 [Gammaproteobacteria bacterium]|nr:hypothetical protein [Gammaproteobacteria bacterium]
MPDNPTLEQPCWPLQSLHHPGDIEHVIRADVRATLDQYLAGHKLEQQFADKIRPLYLPMAAWIAEQQHDGLPLLLGINGAQGSGKSTLTDLLEILLQVYGKRAVSLSIDDLYLPRHSRQQLAETVHPLLATRGVPGTHDMPLATQVFDALLQRDHADTVLIPRFDKSIDDRLPMDSWLRVDGPVDIVLFEGWCVGARAQLPGELTSPVNELESSEDGAGVWRSYVNDQLAGDYQQLFGRLDKLIMLKVPSMEQVYEWRGLQESKLRDVSANDAAGVMKPAGLRRFIMHFERLTRYQLAEMPQRADVLMPLNKDHQVADVMLKGT